MVKENNQKYWILISLVLLLILFSLHLMSWEWSFDFFDDEVIFQSIRLPRTLATFFSGILLAVSGLLLQILFANPLAGPSVLGISSGASLGVALAVIAGVGNSVGIPIASLLGALLYTIALFFSMRFVKSTNSLLLIGIMLSSFTSAFISILQVYAQESKLKYFVLWGMGSLQQINEEAIIWFAISTFFVLFLALFIHKDLSVFSQGEHFARFLGVNNKRLSWTIVLISSISVAVTTAFCGPIAFVGIAVPNMVRLLFKTSNSLHLLIGCMIFGPALLLFCDGLILALDNHFVLPINSVTAIFGVPFIIWIILKQGK